MSTASLAASLKNQVTKMPVTSVKGVQDAAWAPRVPIGHSGYTWMGDHSAKAPASHKILGCTMSTSAATPAEAPVVAEAAAPVAPKAAAPAAPKAVETTGVATFDQLSEVDLVVGQIVSVKKHPDADSLYIEEIDVGEARGGVRVIVSGLVNHIPIEEMENRKLVVVANLKPSALRGVVSNGMVLAAKDDNKVVLVNVPADAKPGDRVIPAGLASEWATKAPATEINPKKKNNVWGSVVPSLTTDAEGNATFNGTVLQVNGQTLTSAVPNGILS